MSPEPGSSSEQAAQESTPLAFLDGGGEMGRRLRAWAAGANPLGPPDAWPQALRTSIRLILQSGHPMYVWWGPDLLCFYNDAYSHSIGPERHPGSLGQPGRIVWDEIWPIIGSQVDHVMAGKGAIWQENALVPITRNNRREEVYWTYSYSPIDDDEAPNGVGGVLVVCSETTSHVMAQLTAASERERQQQLLRQMPGFVAVMSGPEHIYTYVNDAYLALAGQRDFIGRSVRDAFPDLKDQGYFELLDRVYATGQRYVVGATRVQFAGETEPRFVDLLYEPTRDAEGNITGVFAGGYDVTERKTAEDRLILSEEHLRLATESAGIGTWDLDMRTDTLTWSDRTKAMFGISPDVACSMDDFYAGLHPDDRDATARAFAAAVDPATRTSYDVEYRTIGKEDGLVRWVAAKGKGLFDEQGLCYRAVGTAIDVTDRKRSDARRIFMLQLSDLLRGSDTEVALDRVSALMGEFFGASRVGYGHLDAAEDVFDYSVCWTDGIVPPLLGRFPSRAFGVKIVERLRAGATVVVADLQSDPISDEPETRQTAAAVDTRSILVVPFLRHGLLRTIVYLNDRKVRAWQPEDVAFMEEVAERTRQVIERGEAEAALRDLNASLEARIEERTRELRLAEEALRQSQKMEALGQLTGGIAHDFNNLLQGISGSLEIVRKRIELGRANEVARFIEGAVTSANRAAALTQRLLAFARQQPLDARAVEVNPLLESMRMLVQQTVGERISLEMRLADGLWVTRCDQNQLESAVLNLVINARDAMPEGGELIVSTHNVSLGPAESRTDVVPGDYVCVSVADTGIGMSAPVVERAFEPFFTTKALGKGTGLGLASLYGFARQSEGDATIQSEEGVGTTIRLYLPRYEGDVEVPQDSRGAAVASHAPTASVLVVEDDAVVRSLIVEVLSELGCDVTEAGDGPAGLSRLQDSRHIDLLVTDLGLPGLDGAALAERGRLLRPDLKVMFVTGYAHNGLPSPEKFQGGVAIMSKPFRTEEFAAQVMDLLSSQAAAS